ncbi:MAG: hypothetical protein A2W11_03200 [Ignavibacteria bacterium RBG_16_35_7]|nr:MAG: hypothetical protein A2W11_03200 [Ignavibacteria bacterium RBG_16_35_7]
MKTIYVIIACLMILLSTDFSLANIQQGNWRWRNDDGDVYTATWKDSVNTPVILTDYENIRLRIESTAWDPDTSNISLRYAEDGYKPYWINDEDFWTRISSIDTGKFYISPSLYLLDTASYFDNRLLPLFSGWDTIFRYRKTITLDYEDNYNLLIRDSTSLFEFEYSLKPTLKIQPGSAYFFSLFDDSTSMWNRSNSDYAVLMTPPINWFTQSFQSEYTYCYLNDVYFTAENTGMAVGYGWNDVNNGGLILKTIDGGKTWIQQFCPTEAYNLMAVCFANKDIGTAVGDNGIILRTTNGGESWIKQSSGTTCVLRGVCFTNADTGTVIGNEYTSTTNNSYILRTTNGGTTWTKQFYNNKTFLAVSFSDENKGTIVGAQGIIIRTTNGGESWSPQVSGITNGDLSCVSFIDENNGFAVGAEWDSLSRSVIIKTTNGGANWFKSLYGQPGPYLTSVQFVDQNTGWAVGEYGRILKSTDSGLNWKKLVSGISRTLNAVHFIDSETGWVVGQNGKILKTTNGGITTFVDEKESNFIPDKFYLSQNYPNPFNPTTSIQYAVSSRQFVSLKVYDILGNEIETLVNEEKQVGTYELTWNAASLSSGVYFYQLKAGNFIETKKMILLK